MHYNKILQGIHMHFLHPSVSWAFRALLCPPIKGVTNLGTPVSHLPYFHVSSISARIKVAISAIRSLSSLKDTYIQLLLLSCRLGISHLVYLLSTISPLPPSAEPMRRFDVALREC